jgi:hypothetical protein
MRRTGGAGFIMLTAGIEKHRHKTLFTDFKRSAQDDDTGTEIENKKSPRYWPGANHTDRSLMVGVM